MRQDNPGANRVSLTPVELDRVIDEATSLFEKEPRLDMAAIRVEGKGIVQVPCPAGSYSHPSELNLSLRERVKRELTGS